MDMAEAAKHTPGPWTIEHGENNRLIYGADHGVVAEVHWWIAEHAEESRANARLIAAAPDLLVALQRAQAVIDGAREDLHHERVADWFPEGVHEAATRMSESMRLIGNWLAEIDFSAAIAKATSQQPQASPGNRKDGEAQS